MTKKEIKNKYKLNKAPDRIQYNYEKLYKALKHEVQNHCNKLIDKDFIETIEKEFSINYGPDKRLVYNCPECGQSKCLYIGNYGDMYKEKYQITCDNCEFICPKVSKDYGETWTVFDEYLHTKGYLK